MDYMDQILLKYEREIRAFFEPFMEANEDHLFNWDVIFTALEHFRSLKMYSFNFRRVFFNFVLPLFEYYKCRDMNIIVKLVGNYCLYDDAYSALVRKQIRADVYIRKLMKVKHGEFKTRTQMDPIQIALNRLDENVLDFLIKQGIAYLPPIDDSCEWNYLKNCLGSFRKPEFLQFETGEAFILKISQHYKRPEARRRLLIVIKVLEIMAFRKNSLYEKWSRCMQKVFQTIPEPHVTSQEFRTFLRQVSYPDAEEVIEEFSREYEFIFPESYKAKQPRSLLHLSRCQVRQNLRTAGTFPDGVKHLDLPKVLEKSVLLQNCVTYKPHLN